MRDMTRQLDNMVVWVLLSHVKIHGLVHILCISRERIVVAF